MVLFTDITTIDNKTKHTKMKFLNEIEASLQTNKKISFGNSRLKVIEDYGIQGVQDFKEVRYFKIKYLKSTLKLGLHFYQRHNGPCLAVTMFDKQDIFRNIIQYVLKEEEIVKDDKLEFHHNGVIGGGIPFLTKKKTIEYLSTKKTDLVIVDSSKILLGIISADKKLNWKNKEYSSFITNLVEYSIHRRILKNKYMSDSSPKEV